MFHTIYNKTQRAFENIREMFSTFLQCSQLPGVFYHSVLYMALAFLFALWYRFYTLLVETTEHTD